MNPLSLVFGLNQKPRRRPAKRRRPAQRRGRIFALGNLERNGACRENRWVKLEFRCAQKRHKWQREKRFFAVFERRATARRTGSGSVLRRDVWFGAAEVNGRDFQMLRARFSGATLADCAIGVRPECGRDGAQRGKNHRPQAKQRCPKNAPLRFHDGEKVRRVGAFFQAGFASGRNYYRLALCEFKRAVTLNGLFSSF